MAQPWGDDESMSSAASVNSEYKYNQYKIPCSGDSDDTGEVSNTLSLQPDTLQTISTISTGCRRLTSEN